MTDKNYEKSVIIYEKFGQSGVFKAVESGELKCNERFEWCQPCEIHSPIWGNACLVCGTQLEGIKS